jgi:hypothetical protein
MLLKFLFSKLSKGKQVRFMQKRGIILGQRWKNGRQIYIYMYRNLFAEVLYVQDDPAQQPESVILISGLKNLNQYLEKDSKSAL